MAGVSIRGARAWRGGGGAGRGAGGGGGPGARRRWTRRRGERWWEPGGLGWRPWGFLVSPPRALHPLVEREPRKLAHSERLVLPRRTTPALRSFSTTVASRGAIEPRRALL